MPPKQDPWVRVFNVSDPTRHTKGYTIYRVQSKVFPKNSPEAVTEVTVWKRYNDFKKLHRHLQTLHSGLYLKGMFPPFPKAKVFGRFDAQVVEERQKCALELLEFAAQHPPLFTNQVFVKFFEMSERSLGERYEEPSVVARPNLLLLPTKVPQSDSSSSQSIRSESTEPYSSDHNDGIVKKSEGSSLGGVWKYPQPPDTISLNSDDTDEDAPTTFTDSDSVFSSTLSVNDLSIFDPLSEQRSERQSCSDDTRCGVQQGKPTNSWLLSAMLACSQIPASKPDTEEFQYPKAFEEYDDPFTTNVDKNFGSFSSSNTLLNITDDKLNSVNVNINLVEDKQNLEDGSRMTTQDKGTSNSEDVKTLESTLSLFDPILSKVSSDFNRSIDAESGIATNGSTTERESISSDRKDGSSGSNCHSPHPLSPLQSDRGGEYLCEAATFISQAHLHEANCDYEAAFECYKAGVGALIKGVQNDSNVIRRDAVRRKTAQYLLRAEEIYNQHLSCVQTDEQRWSDSSLLSPTLETTSPLQAPPTELRKYRVLGIVDKVLLVLDSTDNRTYVIKVLRKTPTNPYSSRSSSLVPSKIAHMVQLYLFIETEYAIFLVLEYASGGKLWNYVSSYMPTSPTANDESLQWGQDEGTICDSNVYSGRKDEFNKSPSRIAVCQRLSSFESDIKDSSECPSSYLQLFTNYAVSVSRQGAVGLCSIKDLAFGVKQTKLSPQKLPVQKSELSKLDKISSVGEINDNLHNKCDSMKDELILNQPFEEVDHFKPDSASLECSLPKSNQFGDADFTLKDDAYSWRDLQNIDAQELILESEKLLRHVEETLRNCNDLDMNGESEKTVCNEEISASNCNHVDSTNEINLIATTGEDKNNVEVVSTTERDKNNGEGFSTNEDKNSKSENFIECETGEVVQLRQKKSKNCDINSRQSGDVSKRSSAASRQSRFSSTDDVLVSPTNETRQRKGSSTGSLELPRSRLRKLSSLFHQLDVAAENRKSAGGLLPETGVRLWAAEIVIAISRLHNLGVICRDLNPHNILLGENGHILLSYFGQWSSVESRVSIWAIENLFVAPEACGIFQVTPASDWWSLGALLFELLTGMSLLSCHPGGLHSHSLLNIPGKTSPEAKALLQELLRYLPQERLGAGVNGVEEIKAHPFFNGVDWRTIANT